MYNIGFSSSGMGYGWASTEGGLNICSNLKRICLGFSLNNASSCHDICGGFLTLGTVCTFCLLLFVRIFTDMIFLCDDRCFFFMFLQCVLHTTVFGLLRKYVPRTGYRIINLQMNHSFIWSKNKSFQ